MGGSIRTWPDGDGVSRIVRKLEQIDPDGTWEEVYTEAIAVYLGVTPRVVKQQLESRRKLMVQRRRSVD